MLNDWLKEKFENVKIFLEEYGKIFFASVGVVVLFVCLYFIFIKTNEGELTVTFFDVGQGDSIFVETPSHKQMLIDGGPNNKVMQKLNSKMGFFDNDIDVVVATHADADHITGLIPVFEKYNVKNVIESPVKGKTEVFNLLDNEIESHSAKSSDGTRNEKNGGANPTSPKGFDGARVYIAKTGDEIDFNDGVIAKVLYPVQNLSSKTDTNEASVCILLTYQDKTFLFTGDLPSVRENKLIESNLLSENVTIYKAGHHGSKNSSGEQLLSYIKPYYAVISAGKDNKYGHPNIETIERLKKYGKVIFSTIDLGDVEFILNGKSFEVRGSH